jgi:hypothetical protein
MDWKVTTAGRMIRLIVLLLLSSLAAGVHATELTRGTGDQRPQQPQVAIDASGAIHVVYGIANDIVYRHSRDGGKTFSDATRLPAQRVVSLGMRRGPRIAATDRSICITYVAGKQGMGRDGDVLATRSADGGATWSAAVPVNDSAASAREGLHAMAAGPSGELCCVWLDLREQGTVVMASLSHDGGTTWSPNQLVYRSPDGSVCECCHPSVALDHRGNIVVLWRNALAGNRDMYLASSLDGGKTFGAARKLGAGAWPLDACPMDGGAIALLAGDQVATAWRREQRVYSTMEDPSQEQLVGEGEQPWLAATDEGPFLIWLKKRGGTAFLRTPQSPHPIELAQNAADPVIATGPNGHGPVVAVWESRDGAMQTIECLVIRD